MKIKSNTKMKKIEIIVVNPGAYFSPFQPIPEEKMKEKKSDKFEF